MKYTNTHTHTHKHKNTHSTKDSPANEPKKHAATFVHTRVNLVSGQKTKANHEPLKNKPPAQHSEAFTPAAHVK